MALNWLMMALEGPLLVGLIGRMPMATENLAAFSVAFAIAMMIEAPIMMLLSAGAALARDRASYERLWHFATALNLPLSLLMGIVGLPEIFLQLNTFLWKLPEPMALRVARALWILIPWPAVIGYRRLWQGVLIRQGQSRLVAWGTVLRLVGMGIGALVGSLFLSEWPGTWIAALALSFGVTTEMLIVRLWASPYLGRLGQTSAPPLSYREIGKFYFPLLLTSLLNVALVPLLTTLMSQGRMPLLSLAAYPAVSNTVFLFSCIGVAYQEVVVVLLGTRVRSHLVSFAHLIALGTTLSLGLLSFPGLREVWLGRIFSVPGEVLHLASVGLLLILPMPALVVYLAILKGMFIWAHQTRLNLLAAIVELGSVLAATAIFLFTAEMIALYGALVALVLARLLTLLVFLPVGSRIFIRKT
ncbi:MAG: hypothetical protein N2170_09035 [Bacteroidia bacterium]|nr:hypothetical protein [Bacteroidia bacterium]